MVFYFVFAIVLALDQITKGIIIAANTLPIQVTSFFNLVFVLNRGVSFSLLSSESAWAPWALTGLGITISSFIAYYFFKEKNRLIKFALSLVLAGAIGNIIDRIRYQAVIDFLDFHINSYHWPAFNVADSMICFGVFLIVFDVLFLKERKK